MKHIAALSCVVVLCLAGGASAGIIGGIQPGIKAGFYTDPTDFAIGGDVNIHLLRVNVDPNMEVAFVKDARFIALNLDAFINVSPVPVLSLFAGAGYGFRHLDPDEYDATNQSALNLIVGSELNVIMSPYLQLKWVVVEGEDDLVIFAGIRF